MMKQFVILFTFLLLIQCASPQQLSLLSGQSSISVDLDIGGRISSLMFDEIEVLKTSRDSKQVQWGSTVWPSPQKEWNWPPPAWIDKEPYSLIEYSAKHILIESQVSPESQIQCRKNISVIGVDSFLLHYTFLNQGSDSIKVGIWENTRIPYEGIVRWEEERALWELGSDFNPASSYNTLELTRHSKERKVFSKSEGGYLDYTNKGILFKKTFESIEPGLVANSHAAIEIYYDPITSFAELELQGKYENIAPGEEISFEVVWALSEVE